MGFERNMRERSKERNRQDNCTKTARLKFVFTRKISLPAQLTVARYKRANFALRGLAGLFSVSLGLFTMYEIGFVNHLFTEVNKS